MAYRGRPAWLLAAALVLAAGWMGFSALSAADETPTGKVTVLEGKADVKSASGSWTPLLTGSVVKPGDEVRTANVKKTRIEITLGDQSVVRLGRNSDLVLEKAMFGGSERQFSGKLQKGEAYALASKNAASGSTFEITTGNAVAGVRGTAFRIDASNEKSTVVRVYSGAVAVSNAPIFAKPGKTTPAGGTTQPPKQGVKPGGPGRVVVAGPHEVTKKEWEEFVVKEMQEIKVSDQGVISAPVAFDPKQDEKDEWVAWNKSRDAAANKQE